MLSLDFPASPRVISSADSRRSRMRSRKLLLVTEDDYFWTGQEVRADRRRRRRRAIRDRDRYSCVKRENGDENPLQNGESSTRRDRLSDMSFVAAAAHHDRLPTERSTTSLSKWRGFARLPCRRHTAATPEVLHHPPSESGVRDCHWTRDNRRTHDGDEEDYRS